MVWDTVNPEIGDETQGLPSQGEELKQDLMSYTQIANLEQEHLCSQHSSVQCVSQSGMHSIWEAGH